MKKHILLITILFFMLPQLFAQRDAKEDFLDAMEVDHQARTFNPIREKAEKKGYSSVQYFYKGIAPAQKNGKWGYINTDVEVVVPFKYDNISYFNEDRAAVMLNEKWGVVDKNGTEVIPLKYEDVTDFKNGKAYVALDKKWGIIKANGILLSPIKYDNLQPFGDYEITWVQLNNRFGLINLKGEEITALKYDGVQYIEKRIAVVYQNQKYGIVDFTGKEITPLKYETILLFADGEIWALYNNQIIQLAEDGNEMKTTKDFRIETAMSIADNLYDSENIDMGYKWYMAAATEGDSEAMLQVAQAYDQGKGIEKNNDKAMEWLQESINAGNADAINYLGERFEKGTGTRQDYMKALEYFMEAGQKGSEKAIQNFQRVRKEALEEYLPSAERNEAEAMAKVGILYLYQLDYENALKWLSKADEKGFSVASAALGALYRNGQGVGKDYSIAVGYLEKAVESDFENQEIAYQMLSEMYESGGYGLQKNAEKAKKYKAFAKP